MTKKSDGRLKRDQQKQELNDAGKQAAESNSWDSLEHCYQHHMQLFGQYLKLSRKLIEPEVQANILNQVHSDNLARGMDDAVCSLHERTEALHNGHKGKTGLTKNDAEWFDVVTMFQSYAALIEEHQMLVTPMAHELTEIITAAEFAIQHKAKIAAQAKKDLLNPNVVSDVVVMENK